MAVKTGIAQKAFGTATDRRCRINHYLLFLTIRAAVSPEQDGAPHKQAFDWAAGHKAEQTRVYGPIKALVERSSLGAHQ